MTFERDYVTGYPVTIFDLHTYFPSMIFSAPADDTL